LSGLAGFS